MKETLLFLSQLSQNNTKEWMEANKSWYLKCKEDFKNKIELIIEKISLFDNDISGLKPSDCIFRINRDIRFSKNKAPYKTNFGASIAKGGKKSFFPTYYLHIEPQQMFIAGGIYHPMPEQLKKIRQEIDYNGQELQQILSNPSFQKVFGSFTYKESLKNPPKGYEPNHPFIEILKMKNFLVECKISENIFEKPDWIEELIKKYQLLLPFNQFFKKAVEI